jgi:hypothetical protein
MHYFLKMTTFWDIAPCSLVEVVQCFIGASFLDHQSDSSIALIVETARTSEISAYFNETTQCYIAEGCHPNARRRENLKYYTTSCYVV